MMIFPTTMKPEAVLKNEGKPYTFICDMCGEKGEGRLIQPSGKRESWAVLPEEWEEVEDRREHAKKQFVISCSKSDCLAQARKNSNVG
jgi:hypothetical protein